MKNGNLLEPGCAVAAEEPGLGIVVNCVHLAMADFHGSVLSQGNSSITASAALSSHCPHFDARGDMK